MPIKRLSPNLIKPLGASDGDVLSYVAANTSVEWVAPSGGASNNSWINANDYTTYTTLSANDYTTYTTLSANDYTTYTTLLANDYTTYTTLSANDYNSYITLLANDYNSYATLLTYVDNAIANLVNSAPETLDTLNEIAASLGNDANLAITLTTQINSIQTNVYALTLDTIVANGNTTSRIIEVSGLYSNNFLIVDGPSTFNSNISINGSIETVDFIKLNTSVANDTVQGQFSWNYDEGTVHLGLNDSVSLKIGQDSYFYVKAAQPISKGNVVYASGAVGNSGAIEVSLYIANNSIEERYVLGIAAQNISQGELGYVTALGVIRQFNASGALAGETWNLGDILYPSATVSGGLTNQPPEAPNQDIPIAFVTSNSTNGSIAVRAFELGYHLNEIHDVYETNKQDNDVLTWVTANARWEPKSISIENASANDYTTYLQAQSNDYSTLLASYSNDYSTYLAAQSNDYSSYLTLEANVYNTFAYLNANVGAGGDSSNAWVNANDYTTFTTLNSRINTVQSNVTSISAAGIINSETFTTVSTSNTFSLYTTVGDANNIIVSLSGIVQYPTLDYVVSGSTLTLSNVAPITGGLVLEVRYLNTRGRGSDDAVLFSDSFSVDGSTNAFTLSGAVSNKTSLLVYFDGLLQHDDTYETSGNTLTIANSAPLQTSKLSVRALNGGSSGGGGGGVADTSDVANLAFALSIFFS